MKIIVCIKQVPDTTEIKLDPVKGTLIRDGVPSIMNPDDKGALEQALLFKDAFGAEVSVITMGPPQATAIIREAFAMGCDKGYLVTDRRFGGADTLATSYTISQALKSIEYDIVLAGRQAIDGDTAQVGPQIAEQLDLPQITYVEKVEFDGDKKLTVYRNVEEGHEILEVELPCMLTFLASAYEPRYMNVADIMTAYDKEIITLTADSFEVDETRLGLKGSPTRVRKSFTKGAKAMGVLHEDLTPDQAAELILEKMKEKFII
ncbi:MAG: electron transfer flavoprotein subunit beta/FixA family protein [Bacteroidales bacterium]|uniref:electron transfer flavoprotein subunit beta/FixA family protein n=1 Tax=Porphyromonas sp. TaxID=1924944 RepID=UPI0029782A49|nr:electron transfer flavoprotein subunit beta/FixA family protein [Porphyromonas sp.]MDD7438127.1 electron transfer flavoprotein subunit beta/FixA family protein [Bacteroidales bacterium]MDY3066343.1 electron transfer flavoprotein subunit beta/FixA family protein [Porphyromonas sp.]